VRVERQVQIRKVKLKDVCTRITVGHVGPMVSKYSLAGVPFLRSQNITPFRLNLADIKYIPQEFHVELKKSALYPGDVAIVRTGYPGTACVIPNSFNDLNCSDLVIITPSEELNPHYLAAIFNSAWGIASVAGSLVGVAQQHFNIGAAKELIISLPSRTVQDRIAGILSAYDELIENSQRRIKILESMARALYREWFVHFRFPGHESHPRVASPLGEIPAGWEVRPFSALASYVNGYPFKPAQLGKSGKPIVKIKELKAGIAADTPRNQGDQIPEKFHIKDGDILFSWSADIDSYIWMGGDGLLNQHLFNVLPTANTPHFFCFHALKESMPRFRALSLGATMHHIKRSALDQIFTAVPTSTIRVAFEAAVAPIHAQQIVLSKQVNQLRATRELLLPRLLSGQIPVEGAPA
jgi:type I restriction enzyme, S subunit